MFGIIHTLITSFARGSRNIRDGKWDKESRDKAIENDRPYYIDYYGNIRSVETDNRVMYNHYDSKTENTVMADAKTGNIIHTYPSYKEKCMSIFEENQSKAREQAIKDGRKSYTCTIYSDANPSFGEVAKYRTEDNLRLTNRSGNGMWENKYGLWLGDQKYKKLTPSAYDLGVRLYNMNVMSNKRIVAQMGCASYANCVGAIMEEITKDDVPSIFVD